MVPPKTQTKVTTPHLNFWKTGQCKAYQGEADNAAELAALVMKHQARHFLQLPAHDCCQAADPVPYLGQPQVEGILHSHPQTHLGTMK